MPEVHVSIIWPNEKPDQVYSPSTVIKNYFTAGETLTVNEFLQKADGALSSASKRVKERFGYECTSAMGELERLRMITDKIEDKHSIIKIISLE